MSAKPYTPLPGSVASRAITWLKAQPAGSAHSCAVIGEAVDFEANGVQPCLTTAVTHGLVIKEKINGLVTYRMGEGKALAQPTEQNDPALVIKQVWTPTNAAAAPPEPTASAKPTTQRKVKRAELDATNLPLHDQIEALQAASTTGFFVGASMGGDIQIHKGGVVLTLDDQEFAFAVRMAAALYPNTYTPVA